VTAPHRQAGGRPRARPRPRERGVTAPLVLLAWAVLLALNAGVLLAFGGGALPVALLGGAAGASAVLGVVLAARGGRPEEPRPAPELSGAAALAGACVAGIVIGAELGLWLVLISAGALVLALAALAREDRGADS
jgi:hypothetical protein